MKSDTFFSILKQSVPEAYSAMENPREGTILSVLRKWAEGLYESRKTFESMEQLLSYGLDIARQALLDTPEELDVLKENGVVDAGALGFTHFLEGVENLGRKGPVSFDRSDDNDIPAISFQASHAKGVMQTLQFRYCSEFLLLQPRSSADEIKKALSYMGDSLIVSAGRNKIRIHIHSNSPDQVMEYLTGEGQIIQQKVDDMLRQEQMLHEPLSRVAILTDSIADIPEEWMDRYQIHMIPLNLIWDNYSYLDRMTLSPGQFYRLQQERKSFPGSSLPDAPRVDSVLSSLLEHYEHVLVLSVASQLSGTYNLLKQRAERFNRERNGAVIVIDSCMNSAAQGLFVTELAKEAAGGKSISELIELAEDLKKRIKIYVSVETFKFMVRGGRMSPLKGAIASLLNLKPIVSLDETGKGQALDKAFSQKGLMRKILSILISTERERGIERFVVVHGDAEDRARLFQEKIENALLNKKSDYITEISPVVGMHAGKGAIAVAVLSKS